MSPVSTAPAPVGFDNATRNNLLTLPSLAYSPGARSTLTLPKVGYLSRILLEVVGSVTMAHLSNTLASAYYGGPYALIDRVRVSVNNVDIVDMSGYALAIENLLSTYNWRGDASGDAQTYAFPRVISSGGTANAMVFQLEIPIALNDRDLIGLALLQSEQTQVTLSIDWGTVTANGYLFSTVSEVTTFSAISFNAYPTIEFFDVPANPADRPPMDFLYQTIEERKDIVAVGQQTWPAPRSNIYTRLFWWHHHNATLAPSTDVTDVEMRYNQSNTPYRLRSSALRGLNRNMYGRDLPAATYVLDFNHQGIPDLGTARDYVNTANITDVELRPTIAAGATLGSGTNRLHVVRQQLVKVA